MTFRAFAVFFFSVSVLAACKPSGPPPDILKSQREDIEKAKAVEGQLQHAADEQRKQIDGDQDK